MHYMCCMGLQCKRNSYMHAHFTSICMHLQAHTLIYMAVFPLFYCKRNIKIEILVSAHQRESDFAPMIMMFDTDLPFCECQFNFLDSYRFNHQA